MTPTDHEQRLLATDPTKSFIVQAPAGSGKTEMLVQRFLRLLATVEHPEQVVALTFTRKAANEMRERIILALQAVIEKRQPESPHQMKTFTYASEALAQDKRMGWVLHEHPGRLQMMTIDGFCQMLVRSMPNLATPNTQATISESPEERYKEAAQACLLFMQSEPDYQTVIRTLLIHLGNRQDTLLALFCHLLATRDQWIGPLLFAQSQDKTAHEHALAWIEQHELSRLRKAIPHDLEASLIELSRQIAIIENDINSPRYALHNWESLETLDRNRAKSLASLLLTAQDELRRQFTHHVGFRRNNCTPEQFKNLKEKTSSLLESLSGYSNFTEALVRVKDLPSPRYDENQWRMLNALFTTLPLLVAHLELNFSEYNEQDFIKVAEQALAALGNDQTPTDLALYLDYRIQHILIDEFQDTSIVQFQLLSKLVHEWQTNDGKTLFLVGDPMQSIYRFRAAEVGLFLRAQQHGIANLKLTPLLLHCNFRSNQPIIQWVNEQFAAIFPSYDDIESGAIAFHPSVAIKAASSQNDSYTKAFETASRDDEATAIVHHVQKTLTAYPEENIAILVRSRQHLRPIINELKQQNVPFQGVDIDSLSTLPHLRDVWILTQALLQPANRLAWLALLRSPWCGMSLSDIHKISKFSRHVSIYLCLTKLDRIPDLSPDGRKRAFFVQKVMHQALSNRHQQSIVPWIMQTLEQLHINHILTIDEDRELEQYWKLLEQFETHGQLKDLNAFKDAFEQLYAENSKPAPLSIMTIHKSKGLEFDTVILPCLGAVPRPKEATLLRWLRLPTGDDTVFLLSPMKAVTQERCALHDYLGKLDTEKAAYEQQRLLYVAATRAKKRLMLFDTKDAIKKGSFRDLLHRQRFESTEVQASKTVAPQESPAISMAKLVHLPSSFYEYSKEQIVKQPHNVALPSSIDNERDEIPRILGIVTHALLQWICTYHPSSIQEVPWNLIQHQMQIHGVPLEYIDDVEKRVRTHIINIFNDPIGQWIIQPRPSEKNEYELLIDDNNTIATRIIDRTFIEDGKQWVVDFKTGYDSDTNVAQYRAQVNKYAALLLTQSISEPCNVRSTPSKQSQPMSIACGLYFLNNNRWIQWEYGGIIHPEISINEQSATT